MNTRLVKIQEWLKSNHAAFTFISDPTNVFYLTNFKCDPHERFLGLFVFPDNAPFLVCPELEVIRASESGFEYDIIGYQDHEDPWIFVKKQLEDKRKTSETVAIETSTLPYQKALKLKEYHGSCTFISIEPIINTLRNRKDARELEALKKAGEMADYAVKVGINAIKKGRTEQAIVAEIEYELTKRGYSEMSFDTMVLTGEKTALPHGIPGTRQIKEGDFVLFDLGVIVDGYCSDITRTVAYKHASDAQIDIYNTVLKAEKAAIEACNIDFRIGDLDKIARQIISDKGYGDYFTHRLGHGLGLGAHEAPSMSMNNDNKLTKGMVFTIEPGIYIPNIGGVRIEDDIYISEDGPLSLTSFPKEFIIVP
ncbi:M24 family metallopeptidase [Terrilactibacillus sp. BCM23-1]|uniref:M24 family metallopeptidase n=1 Tax=Terrilactibacillus tamarindi TaxID=2599694 RepID=A0A6N8CUA0_9BACI|nr:Xaa-Pro peptidase family protein [Terrilactibacillus tamarindi]MTT31656.1 M24 family metallopeptidase [Terrilactibacillus tamarindi]